MSSQKDLPMTQMTVWLDNDANPAIIKQVLQNMKGVMKISFHKEMSRKNEKEEDEWLADLHRLVNNVDTSKIDMKDEKTRYLMSK